jgi:hypothetical protein
VPADEVGVDVRLDHSLDAQASPCGLVEVNPDVAPGIDDDRSAGRLVADQVGSM